MKTVRFFIISIVLCSIVLLSLSCTTVTKPKNPLIGKWEAFSEIVFYDWSDVSGDHITLEFLNDGTFIENYVGATNAGSYRIIEQNRIEFKMGPFDTVAEFSISGNEFTIQGALPDGGGKAWKLRKVK
jgi:hypothetical protein